MDESEQEISRWGERMRKYRSYRLCLSWEMDSSYENFFFLRIPRFLGTEGRKGWMSSLFSTRLLVDGWRLDGRSVGGFGRFYRRVCL